MKDYSHCCQRAFCLDKDEFVLGKIYQPLSSIGSLDVLIIKRGAPRLGLVGQLFHGY